MPRLKPWTDAARADLIARKRAGESDKVLARVFNRTPSAIRKQLYKLGYYRRAYTNRYLTVTTVVSPEELEAIKAAASAAGLSRSAYIRDRIFK